MEQINPIQKPYIKLSPLKLSLTNFPFIDADFDALTDYEFLCKVVEYLNKVIANEEIVSENVQSLYDAFLELQAEIIDKLAEQDQKIDDYFTNTNIQAFVDNRINEMLLSGDFQTLLQNAILDLNPTALQNEKRVNIINFGGTLISSYDLENINDSLFLNTTNKSIIIDALNKTYSNNSLYYYFINGDEDANTYKLFKFDISNIQNGSITLYVYYLMNYINLNNPDVLFNQDLLVTITDNVITDIELDSSTKTIVPLFTGSASGGSDTPIYKFNASDYDSYILFNQYGRFNIVGSDVQPFINILNDAHSKGYKTFLMDCVFPGISSLPTLINISLASTNFSSATSYIQVTLCYNSSDYNTSLAFGSNNTGTNITAFSVYLDISNEEFTGFSTTGVIKTTGDGVFLPINNTQSYEPSGNYNPATKKYVDDNSLRFTYGALPYTAGSDFTMLGDSRWSAFKYGSSTDASLYDVILDLESTTANLTGDVIVAVTPHNYAGFTTEEPTVLTNGPYGIAVVFNNSSDGLNIPFDVRYSPVSHNWEIHLLIPSGTTLTTGAVVNIHLTYMRMFI